MNDEPLPQDPALPHLRLALNGPALAARFEAHTAPAGWHVTACAVDRVKYHPRRNLAVSYRLQLQSDSGATREQIVATRWCTGGASLARWHKATASVGPHAKGWPTATHDAALDLVAHWWPHDTRLAAARTLSDTAQLRTRWLPEVVRALAGPDATLVGAQAEPVQVVPEHRMTVRVQLQLVSGEQHTVYAKADAEGRGARTHAAQVALWASPARLGGALRLPRPLLWQPGSGLHWQQALPGHTLLDDEPLVGAATAGHVGALVAALHGTALPAVPAVPVVQRDDLLQRLQAVRALLEQVEPAWAWRSLPVLRALEDGLPAAADGVHVTLHGDLHPGNVLRHERQLSMIDLDDVHRGPAWLDLGDWCADAVYRALLGGRTAASAGVSNEAFCAGYVAGGGTPLAASRLAWATAWQLVCRRVQRCIVNLKPGRYALVPALLAAAQGLLAGRRWSVSEAGA